MCRTTVKTIRRLDLFDRVELVDATRILDEVPLRYPGLTAADCLNEMQLVAPNGRRFGGFYAFRQLAWLLPAAWVAAPLLYLPGVSFVGRRVYARIAARRARTACAFDPHIPPGV
jgi:hypothetical protein